MYRSSSTTRVSDEFFSNSVSSPAAALVMSSPNPKLPPTPDLDHLPTHNPMTYLSKKDKNSFRSAENAVHLIPLFLLLCAVILWYFSSPVDLVNKSDSVVPRIERPLINNVVDHGHQKSSVEQDDIDPVNQSTDSADFKTTE